MLGYGGHHRIDGFLRQQFALPSVDLRAAALDPAPSAIQPPFVRIDQAHDFGLRMLLERSHRLLPARARANHADDDELAERGTRGVRRCRKQCPGLP